MKSFLFILFSTFCIGILSGVYIYFISHETEPIFDLPNTNNQLERGFEIIADTYGGCSLGGGCSSYRISDSGSLDLITSQRGEKDERLSGMLSNRALTDIKDELVHTPLAAIASSEFLGTCPAFVDGISYRYEIRIADKRYFIDTCENDVADAPLFELLTTYFNPDII